MTMNTQHSLAMFDSAISIAYKAMLNATEHLGYECRLFAPVLEATEWTYKMRDPHCSGPTW